MKLANLLRALIDESSIVFPFLTHVNFSKIHSWEKYWLGEVEFSDFLFIIYIEVYFWQYSFYNLYNFSSSTL